MTLVLDYGRGNLFSLGEALRHLGAAFEISSAPERVLAADRIFFPGVGAFGDAMAGLQQRGLVGPLKAVAERGVPILGICVGCQLLLSRGEEFGTHEGLDIIPGTVMRLPAPAPGDPDATRIPNVGWRRVNVRPDAPVLRDLSVDQMVYFVHSYAPIVDETENIAATAPINGQEIPVAVYRGSVVGVQFHPEKSGLVGLDLLRRFLEFSPARIKA